MRLISVSDNRLCKIKTGNDSLQGMNEKSQDEIFRRVSMISVFPCFFFFIMYIYKIILI